MLWTFLGAPVTGEPLGGWPTSRQARSPGRRCGGPCPTIVKSAIRGRDYKLRQKLRTLRQHSGQEGKRCARRLYSGVKTPPFHRRRRSVRARHFRIRRRGERTRRVGDSLAKHVCRARCIVPLPLPRAKTHDQECAHERLLERNVVEIGYCAERGASVLSAHDR